MAIPKTPESFPSFSSEVDYLRALEEEREADLQGTHAGSSNTDIVRRDAGPRPTAPSGRPKITTTKQWRSYHEPVTPVDDTEEYVRASDETVTLALNAVAGLRNSGSADTSQTRVAIGARANRAFWENRRATR